MAHRRDKPEKKRPLADHELGTSGDQDIIKGPRAGDDARFVPVGSAEDPFAADLITSALGDEGIPVAARAQKDHLLDPLVNPNRAFWVVLVPDEYAERARRIIEVTLDEMHAQQVELERAAEEAELATEPRRPGAG